MGRVCIAAFHGDGVVTYWTAVWEFDSFLRKRNVAYRESRWEGAPSGKPHFRDNTAEFLDILQSIGEFADEIGCSDFGASSGMPGIYWEVKERFPTGSSLVKLTE